MIPAVSHVAFDRDEAHTGFDQSSRQQQTLSYSISTVRVSDAIRLLLNIKRVLCSLGGQQIKSVLSKSVVRFCELKLLFPVRLIPIHCMEKTATIGQPVDSNTVGRAECLDLKAAAAGITVDQKRIKVAAQRSGLALASEVGALPMSSG